MVQLIHGEADKLLESLEKESYGDRTFNRFPRFKLMDDASVVAAHNVVCFERQPVFALSPKLKVIAGPLRSTVVDAHSPKAGVTIKVGSSAPPLEDGSDSSDQSILVTVKRDAPVKGPHTVGTHEKRKFPENT